MKRAEQAELSELILRALNAEAVATAAVYASVPDMAEWIRTDELREQARREVWEALFRIVTDEERQETKSARL